MLQNSLVCSSVVRYGWHVAEQCSCFSVFLGLFVRLHTSVCTSNTLFIQLSVQSCKTYKTMCCFDCCSSDHCMALSFVMVRETFAGALYSENLLSTASHRNKRGVPKGPRIRSTGSQDLSGVGAHISKSWWSSIWPESISPTTWVLLLSFCCFVAEIIFCKAKASSAECHGVTDVCGLLDTQLY